MFLFSEPGVALSLFPRRRPFYATMRTFIVPIEIMFLYSNPRTVIAITVIMPLLQFRPGPPGLSVLLRSHSQRLIGNRDSRNVGDPAKRGSDGRLIHLITRLFVGSPTRPRGGTTRGQDASPLSFEDAAQKLSGLKGACMEG